MGVKNLWEILESCKKTLPLHHLQNKRVCIDLSCWIVQLQNANKAFGTNVEKNYLRGLFHRFRALIALNCSLIIVVDGSIPGIKLSTYRRRLNQSTEVLQDITDLDKVKSVRRNTGSEFSRMIKEAKHLAVSLGIPCLDGIEEAEAQCALLNSEFLCDGCFTSDSDAFLFGARTVYRDICLEKGGYIVCYEMDDIERELGFGRNSLIALALLLGSDYSPGVHGVGPESACQMIKSVGDRAVLQRVELEGISFVRNFKGSKKQGQIFTSNNENDPMGCGKNKQVADQFTRVVNAYSYPKCHSAGSDAVHRVLVVNPFNLKQLQHICDQFFHWPPEKTDEYILPKIAERDLRRFANLRRTSADVGICLSLAEMQIKCPVSSIVKQRKVQGRDCFEVLWEAVSGLKTSIVPADLIESACPERILEFQERRTQAKKLGRHRSRQKKTESSVELHEIDLNLDKLQLDSEEDGTSINNSSLLRRSGSNRTEVNRTTQNIDLDAETPEHESTALAMSGEVIDLVSPQQINSTYQAATPSKIDVIDLSDSENEISPEHVRKARELRLFMAKLPKSL
ncbi:hypothetical protein Leryth_018212 [Lithospermum erythrorhizon]|nr:hypothetical protein Leryth_018212 [Lithospermum erythrorhizon]